MAGISVYEKLQHDFIMIRFLYSQTHTDTESVLDIENDMKSIRFELKEKDCREHGILLSCIDTLFGMIKEGKREKIYDFSDAVHNITEICTGGRTFDAFEPEIKRFCKKYGMEFSVQHQHSI